ncbi:hypothetical protein [Lacisediminihabitans sp. H27-G8]|uniref:hypothetical protein n=1 Tax=Lacisediminihabitans sp. H27-G8 TaxID=3111909 RepID=UPI0038FCA75F
MRILAFVSSIIVATALLMGGVVLLVVNTSQKNSLWILAAVLAMSIFIYGPIILGSFRAYWDVTSSTDSARYYRRLLLIVLGLEVLAAIIIVAFAVLTSTGPLIPVVFIGVGIVLTVAALLIGPAFYRYDLAHPAATSDWVAIEKAQIRKRILAIAITFIGVLVLAMVALTTLNALTPHTLNVLQTLLFALSFACIFAGGVSVFSTIGWNRRLRDVTDRDPSRLRRVARVVIKRKPLDLDEKDLVAAARFAAVISVTMSFQLAYIVLLYVGILLQQINALATGKAGDFIVVIVTLLLATLAILLPLQTVRIQRARRYARDHLADLDRQLDGPAG